MNPRDYDLEAYWMPFTANRQFKAAPRMLVSRARACTTRPTTAARSSTAPPGLWCVTPATAGRRSSRRSGGRPATLDYAPPFQMGHPAAFELANAGRAARAGRPRPRVLHQLGLRVGRHRAQDRARLSPRARRGPAQRADRPRARLSRRGLRRHLGRRHAGQPQAVRQPCSPASITCRTPTTPAQSRSRAASPRMARASRRRPRAPRGAARRVHHRRGDRRAHRGLDRRAGAAAGLSASGCARSATSTASC